jgi:hypothetical protein
MRILDLLMIKGVVAVEEVYPGSGYPILRIYVWPWWYYLPAHRARLDDTLRSRVTVGIYCEIRPAWWPWPSGRP